MNFLNLGLGELLGLMGAISAGVTALYLLDRSKRRQLVATMRFWVSADVRTELKHRRRIQQPWSLALQLISLALLLLAIAGPQLGVFDGTGRDHVLILDTSAWMGSTNPAGQGTLMDQAKGSALAYLNSLPSRDRVMLIRADALATPATAFESSRTKIETAIQASQAGASALNLAQALEFGQRAQSLDAEQPGEIAFVGAARVSAEQASLADVPENLRLIRVGEAENAQTDNVGLRRIGLRRSPDAPDTWEIFVSVRNYGNTPRTVDLALNYAQSPAGSRRMTLPPFGEEQESFRYLERAGGWLEARLNTTDAFPQDDRAIVELPAQPSMRVVVYSNDAATLRPLFQSNPLVDVEIRPTSQYGIEPAANAGGEAPAPIDVVVLDRFAPPEPPAGSSIWIEPPTASSPVPVRTTVRQTALTRWSTDTPVGSGLYTRDVTLESAQVFEPAQEDLTIAEVTQGPVIVARNGAGGSKQVLIGFHPGRNSMRFELATPLMMANILRWMHPATYRFRELEAGTPGNISVPIGSLAASERIEVLDEENRPLPFSLEGDTLQFFAGSPGTVRVEAGDRELVYSLTLPDVADTEWTAPATTLAGVPRASLAEAAPTNLWPWLALLGGLGLLADWLLFGRSRGVRLRPSGTSTLNPLGRTS